MTIRVNMQGNMTAVSEDFHDDEFSTVRIKDVAGSGVTLFFDGNGAFEKAKAIAAIINGKDEE